MTIRLSVLSGSNSVCVPGGRYNAKSTTGHSWEKVLSPFWRLEVTVAAGDRQYRSLKDFYDLFPAHGKIDKNGLSGRKIYFFIPAFQTRNVNSLDRLAVRLTRMQPAFKSSESAPCKPFQAADVWLSKDAAVEMSHLMMYSMSPGGVAMNRKLVESARVDTRRAGLLWLPFAEKNNYLREPATGFVIERAGLKCI